MAGRHAAGRQKPSGVLLFIVTNIVRFVNLKGFYYIEIC